DRPARATQAGGMALLALWLVLSLIGVRLLLAAPQYQAIARIRFRLEAPMTTQVQPAWTGYNAVFFQTEAELIRSEPVLGRVVDELKLDQGWGKKYGQRKAIDRGTALALLRARVTARPVPNTSLIEI